MKKILFTTLAILLPFIASANVGATWFATSTDKGYIAPNPINGNYPFTKVPYYTATSSTATSSLPNLVVNNIDMGGKVPTSYLHAFASAGSPLGNVLVAGINSIGQFWSDPHGSGLSSDNYDASILGTQRTDSSDIIRLINHYSFGIGNTGNFINATDDNVADPYVFKVDNNFNLTTSGTGTFGGTIIALGTDAHGNSVTVPGCYSFSSSPLIIGYCDGNGNGTESFMLGGSKTPFGFGDGSIAVGLNISPLTSDRTYQFPNWSGNFAVATSSLEAPVFVSTSTLAQSVFPNASTTNLSATTLCLIGDTCRTTWPTGAAYPFTPTTNYAVTNQATTGIAWFQNGLNASTTSHFVYASTTALSATSLCLTSVCKTTWPAGTVTSVATNNGLTGGTITTTGTIGLNAASLTSSGPVVWNGTVLATPNYAPINKNAFLHVTFGHGSGGDDCYHPSTYGSPNGFDYVDFSNLSTPGGANGPDCNSYSLTDPGSNWNAASNYYLIPTSGTYEVVSSLRLTDGTTGDFGIGTGAFTTTYGADSATFHWQAIDGGLLGGGRNVIQDTHIEHYSSGDHIIMFAFDGVGGTTASDGSLTITLLSSD